MVNDYNNKRMNENASGNKPLNYKQVLSNPELAGRIVSTHYHMGDFGYSGRKGCDTVKVLAESYGVSQNAVRETLKAAREGRLSDSYGNKVEAYSRKRTGDEVQEVMELRGKGMSYGAIAKEMDRSRTFVSNIVREEYQKAEKAKISEERMQELAYESKLASETGSMLSELNDEAAESYALQNEAPKRAAKVSWFGKARNYAAAAAAGLLLATGISGAANVISGCGGDTRAETLKPAATRPLEEKVSPILYADSSKREVFSKSFSIEEPRIENPVVSEIPEAAGEIVDVDLQKNYDNGSLIADPPVGAAYSANVSGKTEGEPIPIKDRPIPKEEVIRPEPKPEPQPQPRPAPAPAPKGGLFNDNEGKLTVQPDGRMGFGYKGISGDVSGHESKADFGFRLSADNGWTLDADLKYSDKSESWKTANDDKADRTTTSINPTFSLTGKDKTFLFGYNHVSGDEKLRNSSHDVRSYTESGFDITETNMSNMEQKTSSNLDVFSADAKAGKVRIFGEFGTNKSKSNYDEGLSTIVDIDSFPPIVVNNDVTTTTTSKTSFYRLGAGYDFGDVEAGALGRHRATDWSASGELNGASIVDEKGSSKQDTFGLYARMNKDNLEAGAMLLGNSGDDLESSQKIEGALHGNYLFGDKFVAGAGVERSDGGTKGRAAFFWKLNDSKTGKDALRDVGNYMGSAENDNLFPDSTTKDQKHDARMARDMSAAADGLLFVIEGGKEGVDRGDYKRVDAGAPIPGTDGKAFVYGSYEDGTLEKRVEGGAGIKLGKHFTLRFGGYNSQDKEDKKDSNGLEGSVGITW